MTFTDHFSACSAGYAAYRPQYPESLFDFLARESPARNEAWDAGTGNGQAAIGLARHFGHVTATDPSTSQIECAIHDARVSYGVGPAEQSELPDASIDLVTAAQAVHWFDRPKFWSEVQRVLRPRGIIAIWTYAGFEISAEIDEVIQRFYSDVVGPYWPPERRMVETRYQTIEFPFDEFRAPEFVIEQSMTMEEVAGYVRSWSATRAYMKQQRHDPVDDLVRELSRAWGAPEQARLARWPVTMRIGRVA